MPLRSCRSDDHTNKEPRSALLETVVGGESFKVTSSGPGGVRALIGSSSEIS